MKRLYQRTLLALLALMPTAMWTQTKEVFVWPHGHMKNLLN